MKCDLCLTENKEGAKFCAKCGTTLSAPPLESFAETKSCPKCGKALKLNSKFCSVCGYSFQQAAAVQVPEGIAAAIPRMETQTASTEINQISPQIEKKVVEVKSENIPESTKPCQKCGKVLKLGAKFCGGCGYNFQQVAAVQVPEGISDAISLMETQSASTEINEISPQIEKNVVQVKPENIPELEWGEKLSNNINPPSTIKKGFPVTAIASGIGLVAVVGIVVGAIYYYKSHNSSEQDVSARYYQKSPVPASGTIPSVPTAAVSPTGVPPAAVSPTIVPPAPVSPTVIVAPAPVKSIHVMAPSGQHVPVPSEQMPAIKTASKPKANTHKKEETKDDRKLLNAIDQYMDKQKQEQ